MAIKRKCAWLMILVVSSVNAADVAVISNPKVAVNEIAVSDLQRLYLGRITEVENDKVKPVDMPKESPVRTKFYQKVLKRTPAQMERYWARALFTGTATPPQEVENEERMKEVVSQQESAVGYLTSESVDDRIKVLDIK